MVAGGEGGVDGDGGVGPVVIACDNFDGARGACEPEKPSIFHSVSGEKADQKKRRDGGRGEGELTC
jgi:hypothetical protein